METMIPAGADALRVLMTRQSHWPLSEPAPDDAQLRQIFDTALRAPDHGGLRPWRFVLIRGDARLKLGEVLVDLASSRSPGEPHSAHEHRRSRALAAPVVIAVVASVTTRTKVPEVEQLLAVGAAAMNMLNAVHAMGFGGFWATGADSYEPGMHRALGLADNDRLLGFLFVGTPPQGVRAVERPSSEAYVTEWFEASA
ncbi:nitroreductase family protein [Caballeronia sordidicola]|uniref:Putative NAD(P)H nitroreductase n=1 Tax=Caballeronia sordidicola TaxID=196367 RepID=A0A158GP07_CABSO|nr:nitroreductase [Caballeronia sordidicola]SAL33825.1 nitroreductase family protein [Caballeronia sordidicola]